MINTKKLTTKEKKELLQALTAELKDKVKLKDYVEDFLKRFDNRKTCQRYKIILDKMPNFSVNDILAIKNYLINLPYLSTTIQNYFKIVKTYLLWCIKTGRINPIKDIDDLKYKANCETTRNCWTDEENENIKNVLINKFRRYNSTDRVFMCIFELLSWNGCRVGEFCNNVNWDIEAPDSNWTYDFETKCYKLLGDTEKHNNKRFYIIPDVVVQHYKDVLNKINIPVSTLKNKYARLSKLVKQQYPNMKDTNISTHSHRYNLINLLYWKKINGEINLDLVDIAKFTGHVSTDTIYNHYLKYNFENAKGVIKRLNKIKFSFIKTNKIDDVDYNAIYSTKKIIH